MRRHDRSCGERIKAAREAQGRSVLAVATAAGITDSYLGRIERGMHDPTTGRLISIAMALGVPVASLLTDTVEAAEAAS